MTAARDASADRPKVLVTGANGFVGSALMDALAARSFDVVGSVRSPAAAVGTAPCVPVGDLGPDTRWAAALQGRDVVVHAAARVHIMQDRATDPLAAFRRANVDGTLCLARQAAAAGIRRFVYLSSVKVNGEATAPGCAFRADDPPAPVDAYGLSKHEAEVMLRQLAAETGMEVAIIRPPLVYGPGVKANFHAMMGWLRRGVPLPLGAVANRRSLVALDNLVDLIAACVVHPAAADQTFLVSDGEDLSTADLLRRLGAALGRPARLVPVPPALLTIGAGLLGKDAVARRLLGSLQVDIEKTRALLDWTPPVTVDEGLRRTAEHFLATAAR